MDLESFILWSIKNFFGVDFVYFFELGKPLLKYKKFLEGFICRNIRKVFFWENIRKLSFPQYKKIFFQIPFFRKKYKKFFREKFWGLKPKNALGSSTLYYSNTAWNVSKYRLFSDLFFLVFGLNMER